MRFQVTQRFDAPVDEVLGAYTDPAFYEELVGLPKIGEPKVLEHTTSAGRVLLRVHYRFTAALPSAATRVIDPAKLTWVEETTYDLGAESSRSRLVPDHYPDRLSASGSVRITAAADGGAIAQRHLMDAARAEYQKLERSFGTVGGNAS